MLLRLPPNFDVLSVGSNQSSPMRLKQCIPAFGSSPGAACKSCRSCRTGSGPAGSCKLLNWHHLTPNSASTL